MADDSAMKVKSDEDNGVIAVKDDAFAVEQHNEDELNGKTAIGGDETSQNIPADSFKERPMDENGEVIEPAADGNCDEKKDKAELNSDQKIIGSMVGFGVAVKKSAFTTHRLCRRLVLVCIRRGKGRANECYQSRPTAKTNCPAMVVEKL